VEDEISSVPIPQAVSSVEVISSHS
jgi:hypothetical protein